MLMLTKAVLGDQPSFVMYLVAWTMQNRPKNGSNTDFHKKTVGGFEFYLLELEK